MYILTAGGEEEVAARQVVVDGLPHVKYPGGTWNLSRSIGEVHPAACTKLILRETLNPSLMLEPPSILPRRRLSGMT